MPAGHAFEHVREIGEGLDVVELGGGDERADVAQRWAPPSDPANRVLTAQRDRPDGTFDGVGVELDAAIIKEADRDRPSG